MRQASIKSIPPERRASGRGTHGCAFSWYLIPCFRHQNGNGRKGA